MESTCITPEPAVEVAAEQATEVSAEQATALAAEPISDIKAAPYSDLKPILSFFATSSIYCITVALIIGFFLIGGLMLFSH